MFFFTTNVEYNPTRCTGLHPAVCDAPVLSFLAVWACLRLGRRLSVKILLMCVIPNPWIVKLPRSKSGFKAAAPDNFFLASQAKFFHRYFSSCCHSVVCVIQSDQVLAHGGFFLVDRRVNGVIDSSNYQSLIRFCQMWPGFISAGLLRGFRHKQVVCIYINSGGKTVCALLTFCINSSAILLLPLFCCLYLYSSFGLFLTLLLLHLRGLRVLQFQFSVRAVHLAKLTIKLWLWLWITLKLLNCSQYCSILQTHTLPSAHAPFHRGQNWKL